MIIFHVKIHAYCFPARNCSLLRQFKNVSSLVFMQLFLILYSPLPKGREELSSRCPGNLLELSYVSCVCLKYSSIFLWSFCGLAKHGSFASSDSQVISQSTAPRVQLGWFKYNPQTQPSSAPRKFTCVHATQTMNKFDSTFLCERALRLHWVTLAR